MTQKAFFVSYSSYPATPSRGTPVSALVTAILMTLCCNQICGIIAIVFSVVAMGKEHDPAEQDRFVGYAWTTMAIGLALTVVIVIGSVLFFAAV